MPRKTFTAGDVLAAADVNNFLMDQSVMTFADSDARDLAIPTPSEGMVTYLEDTDALELFDGSSFVLVGSAATSVRNTDEDTAITAADKGNIVRLTGATGRTITIDDVLAIGEGVDFLQDGAGQITFAAGSGVTIRSKDSNLKTAALGSGATVRCVASGIYHIVGDLAS